MTLQKLSKHTLALSSSLALALSSSLLLSSCGNNGCEKTRESYLSASIKATGRISMSTINAWVLTEQGDSLMTIAKSPTEMEFILRPDTSCTQIRLECTINDSGDLFQYDDTLTLNYEYYPYFLDMECGCSLFFNIQEVSVTNHVFKSVTLKNKEITNEEKVNLELTY